ncbi:hypothetical protein AR543_11000 [Paenibacillus bovis]|uniref:Uncharacterized protein n=1 Tax=Paenibacillus bovis TaxID=1616788 RepID=A0A172ZFU0_9BACL|nr:hypothetical protein AR543_11000 [Paenibacillus bovis]
MLLHRLTQLFKISAMYAKTSLWQTKDLYSSKKAYTNKKVALHQVMKHYFCERLLLYNLSLFVSSAHFAHAVR